jgi:hypothetical protein
MGSNLLAERLGFVTTGQIPETAETYQLPEDGEVMHLVAAGGDARVRAGPADAPDLVATTDAQTFFDVQMRRLDPIEALVGGAIRVTVRSAAVPRCLWLVGVGAADGAPASSMRTKSHR